MTTETAQKLLIPDFDLNKELHDLGFRCNDELIIWRWFKNNEDDEIKISHATHLWGYEELFPSYYSSILWEALPKKTRPISGRLLGSRASMLLYCSKTQGGKVIIKYSNKRIPGYIKMIDDFEPNARCRMLIYLIKNKLVLDSWKQKWMESK
jgi:hypothetical protein